jgi:hypothetical protein
MEVGRKTFLALALAYSRAFLLRLAAKIVTVTRRSKGTCDFCKDMLIRGHCYADLREAPEGNREDHC